MLAKLPVSHHIYHDDDICFYLTSPLFAFGWCLQNKNRFLYSSNSPLGLVLKHTQSGLQRPKKSPSVLSDPQRTVRSWQDFDFCLKAIFLFLRATIRPRNRFAFFPMLSLRLQLAKRRALSSLLSFLKRICLTMPSKRSCTLWWRDADVSMNLQSNTTAQALPSAIKEDVQRVMSVLWADQENLGWKCKMEPLDSIN